MPYPEVAPLQAKIDLALKGTSKVRILEAGCGSSSEVSFPADTHLVGIDISEKQLSRNHKLSEKIKGDLQTYDFPAQTFDAIVCWNVLEHLPHPEKALEKFSSSIKPGGIIILAVPNVLSVKGLITKFTPHSFHVWYYRHYYGTKLAGTEDHGPFPTFLRLAVSPESLKNFGLRNNFTVEHFDVFEYGFQKAYRQRSPFTNFMFYVLGFFGSIFTFGNLSTFKSDCMVLLKKKPS
jgi:SAM-dependent methyltransferase